MNPLMFCTMCGCHFDYLGNPVPFGAASCLLEWRAARERHHKLRLGNLCIDCFSVFTDKAKVLNYQFTLYELEIIQRCKCSYILEDNR